MKANTLSSKMLFLVFTLSLFSFITTAQERQTLKGYVQEGGRGGVPRPYQVSFILKGTKLIGNTVTEQAASNSLEAELRGSLSGNNLFLEELPTPEQEVEADGMVTYCYFTGRLKKEVRNGRIVYSGPYTSRGLRPESRCEGGFMLLVLNPNNPTELNERLLGNLGLTDPPPRVQPVRVATPTPPPPPPKRPDIPLAKLERVSAFGISNIAPKRFTDNLAAPVPLPKDERFIRLTLWKNTTVNYAIYDGFVGDGDAVSIKIDGVVVKNNTKIAKESGGNSGTIDLSDGSVHSLVVILEDEGNEPPSTPVLHLYDGYSVKKYDISGNKGEQAVFNLQKED